MEESIRLDKYLATLFPELSRTRIKNSIKSGNVLVNNSSAKPSYLLCVNDEIKFEFIVENEQQVHMESVEMELNILYEDNDIICINKPPGLVVHPGAGNHTNTLANGLIHHFDSLSNVNGITRPGIVHRLDKNTSGVILIAKSNLAHHHLANQFQDRTIQKIYQAVTWGEWKESEGILDGNIARKKSDPTTYTISKEGRSSETKYIVTHKNRYFSQLTFMPKTGRTHQIRVHLASKKLPIIGDGTYNPRKIISKDTSNELVDIIRSFPRQALHAHQISFLSKNKKDMISYEAPIPRDMQNLIENLKKL